MKKKLMTKKLSVYVFFFGTLLLMASSVSAQTFFLCAGETTKTMPDGVVVPMWGFALEPNSQFDRAGNTCRGTVTVPGPTLAVNRFSNTNLRIVLFNTLPKPVSIVIPGQKMDKDAAPVIWVSDGRVRSFTKQTKTGKSRAYVWPKPKAGTFIYHSGAFAAMEVQMGLYGAMKKDAPGAVGTAYAANQNVPKVTYDNEVLVFYSEIDPALHQAVATNNFGKNKAVSSTFNYDPKYFLVNGVPYEAGQAPLSAGQVGERTLLRFFNAGLQTHVPVLLGAHLEIVAEDGNLYPYTKQQYAVHLPALKTTDAIFSPSAAGNYPLFDRRLDLTNPTATGGSTAGGLLQFLAVTAPPPPAP